MKNINYNNNKKKLKKQIEKLKKQIEKIEEQEKEDAKVGEYNIAEGFKKALEDGILTYEDFIDFNPKFKENDLTEKVKEFFNFNIENKNIKIKEIFMQRGFGRTQSLFGFFYKNSLIFGVINNMEYGNLYYLTVERTKKIYQRQLWNI